MLMYSTCLSTDNAALFMLSLRLGSCSPSCLTSLGIHYLCDTPFRLSLGMSLHHDYAGSSVLWWHRGEGLSLYPSDHTIWLGHCAIPQQHPVRPIQSAYRQNSFSPCFPSPFSLIHGYSSARSCYAIKSHARSIALHTTPWPNSPVPNWRQ